MPPAMNIKYYAELFNIEPIYRVNCGRNDNEMDTYQIKKFGITTYSENPHFLIHDIVYNAKNNRYDKLVGFHSGCVLYLLEDYLYDFDVDIEYPRLDPRNHINEIVKNEFVGQNVFDDLDELYKSKTIIPFENYIDICAQNKRLNFNPESAKLIYRLQGKKAIGSILHQMFSPLQPLKFSYNILPDKNVPCKTPKISKFISGTYFPCVVTKAPTKMRTRAYNSCIFLEGLFGDKWEVFDIYCSHNFLLINRILSERMKFLGNTVNNTKSYICHNYLDLIEACAELGGQCLIRNVRETLMHTSWFEWGKKSYLNVEVRDSKIFDSRKLRKNNIVPQNHYEKFFVTIDMGQNVIGMCTKKDVVITKENFKDYMELFKLQKELEKKKEND